MKLIKILSEGKPEGGFPGLAAVMLSFGLALAAAGGMVLAGCDSPAGVGNGYDGAVSSEAGGTPALSADGTKTIKVKFHMLGTGGGYSWIDSSAGIVGTQNNSHLRFGWAHRSDFTITIIAPAGDEYLNVYWRADISSLQGSDLLVCVQAKMKAESGTITLNYNCNRDDPKLATENLYDVECFWDELGGSKYEAWWEALKSRVGRNDFSPTKTIKVRFEVLDSSNAGMRLDGSAGIVATEYYKIHLVYREDVKDNDYRIAITVPEEDEYLNVYWRGCCGVSKTYIIAKMKAESGTITLNYKEAGKVATKNLYAVRVYSGDMVEWEEFKALADKKVATRTIKVKFDVKNGGYGLLNSYGMVSTEDDDYLVYDGASFADDYTVTITVPQTDEYLNIRWKGTDIWHRDTYVKAKMKPESGTVTLDYNGHKKVATKNLYDGGSSDAWEWEDAKKRAGK